ncbi:Uncharacterised protein [Mycobacteroides abscessus subsp. abscessus]|nr:Uncharacterised protein [Mycobacteroides abscessus subsp. abscessus]SIL08036.1 Uncharacterised protein [Mycobacteroides abscessus subsp. abscessus]SLK58538.1 Uncharacterised protein [Mycobacteroides abscessus subsp. abscessus]
MLDGQRLDPVEAARLYDQRLKAMCTPEEWEVYDRRLHPESYPPELPWWRKLFRL